MATTLEDILAAVASRIVGLGLEYDSAEVPVDVVKGHFQRDTLEDAVRVSVAKSTKAERYSRWSFGRKRVDYFVEVIIQAPHREPVTTFDPDKDLDQYANWRQEVMDVFDKPPLPGASDVFELTAEPLDFLDRDKQKSRWDLQGILVTASIVKTM